MLESVRSGTVDIGFLAQEADRATLVDFSDPYSASGAAYAVRANSDFKGSADVDRAGVTIGAIAGQSPEVYVREHVRNARVQSLPSVPSNEKSGAGSPTARSAACAPVARQSAKRAIASEANLMTFSRQ